jgi:hypothetical protein
VTRSGRSSRAGPRPYFKTGIRRFVAYQKAALAGVVSQANDPRAQYALADYLALGQEILP